MAVALGQKIPRRNTHPRLEERIATSRNGYRQCPVTLKTRTCAGWPKLPDDEEAIRTRVEWRKPYFAGTAIRVEGELLVVDSDISIPEIADEVLEDLYHLDEDAYEKAIVRGSGGVTEALFWRHSTPYAHGATHKYTAHPELIPELLAAYALPVTDEASENERLRTIAAVKERLDPQRLEIYGGLVKARYFQWCGPHSQGREYRTGARTPANTKLSELPLLPIEPDALIDRVDAILGKHLTRIPEEEASASGGVVYDLRPDTRFYPRTGAVGTVEELTTDLAWGAENGIRGCLASTVAGSRSGANCNLYITMRGRVVVADWLHDGLLHYLESDAPPARVELSEDVRAALREQQPPPAGGDNDKAVPPRHHTRIDEIPHGATDETSHNNARDWLIENLAYWPQAMRGRGGAVSIHPDGEFQAAVTIASLKIRMASFNYTVEGVRGGQRTISPVGSWLARPELVGVAGARMRPDMPRPLFREDGVLLVNRYKPPVHPATGGTVQPFLDRMTAMNPEPAEYRWLMNWIAWKMQNPHCRGIAVGMVARDNGAGRGLLAETMQLLLGKQFVVSMPYANISGGAKFNAEVENRLLLYVNEAASAEDQKYRGRNAAREALKDFIEPNHLLPFRVEPKGVDAYYTQASVSTMIFTNNINGLPLDESDRRIAVIVNGPQMSAAERDTYRAWLADPVNIGALHRYFRDFKVERNRDVFDPYMSPRFTGRDLMIEAGKSALDHAWEAAVAKLETAAELYAMSQVVMLTRHLARNHNSDYDDLVRKHTFANGYRIGTKRPAEVNWRTRYGDATDNRQPVFAFNGTSAKQWTTADPRQIKQQLDKAQKVVDEPARAFNKLLQLIEKPAEGE